MTTCQSSNIIVLHRHGIYQGWVLVSCRKQARDVHYNLDQKATQQEILDCYCQQCSRKCLKITT